MHDINYKEGCAWRGIIQNAQDAKAPETTFFPKETPCSPFPSPSPPVTRVTLATSIPFDGGPHHVATPQPICHLPSPDIPIHGHTCATHHHYTILLE